MIVVVLALASVLLALAVWRGSARRHTAERQLELVAGELHARARVTGGYPASLSELGWRLPPIFGRTEAIDPWGRALFYRPPGANGGAFDLKSLGPDGVQSADDLPRKR
jgi:type II secretory pathway pseudopilin PulG